MASQSFSEIAYSVRDIADSIKRCAPKACFRK